MPLENWSDGIVLVRLQDDPQFTDDIATLMEQVQARPNLGVLLDFSEVMMINSSNLARLLKLRKVLAHDHPGRMLLCNINTKVWGIFLATGLDKTFKFVDDMPTGLASLQIAGEPPASRTDA